MSNPSLNKKKEEKVKTGKIGVLPDGVRVFVADGGSVASYIILTDERAVLDKNNVVNLIK